jgi:TetR/AcrR family transcriptional regulator, mexJK operon transcriptional repressor
VPRPARKTRPPLKLSKRERVVAAATKLFLDDGYGATGMDAIAARADVSKATLYSYYGDKAALFAEVMARMCEELGGHRQVDEFAGAPPEEALRAIAFFGLQRVLESLQRRIFQRVVAEFEEFPELGRKFWDAGPGRFEGLLARYLEDAKRRGLLDIDDPAREAARLVGQVAGLYLLPLVAGVRSRPSEAEMRRDVDAIVAGFMALQRRKP